MLKTPPPQIILRVWEGDYGVPTVDPASLQLMTLFKINKVNFTLQHACFPQWCAIPSVQYSNITITKNSELMQTALTLCEGATDNKLTTSLNSRLKAYEKYFLESFADAFYFECWLNEQNYQHAIRTWYGNVIPFPFNYFYLKKMREIARERFESLVGFHDEEIYKAQQLANVTRCLEDFASLLEDGRTYFLGDFPTSLDAIIYSYLAIALQIPLPDSQLQTLIKGHQLLVRFVRNMTQQFFPHVPSKYKYVEPVTTTGDQASTKSLIAAALCVTTAMVLYACSIGLIKFKFPSIDRVEKTP